MKIRLPHFHSQSKFLFVLLFLLSDPFAINDKSPYEGNAKND